MKLSSLPSIRIQSKRRLGQGHGSGRGKTAGRGTKGQNARASMPLTFEGGQSQLIKRVPFLRGKLRNASQQPKAFVVRLDQLETLPAGTEVNKQSLIKFGIVKSTVKKIKILDSGSITKALTVTLPCSNGAKVAIEKAGGNVVHQ